ncbi:MAG: hypothetical protein J6D18_02515, partial [Erysipelotrichaceae bacterium]|nr:hypothetical protein [Erysipelotrichaceae bacterium]
MKKQMKKWLPVFAAAFLCVGLYIAPIYAEETENVETQPVTEQEPTTEPMDEAERIQDVQEPVETPAQAQTPSDEEEVTPVQTPQEPVLTVNENPDIKYPFWIIPLRQGTTGADQMKVSIYQPLSTVKEEVAQHYRDKGFDVVKEQIELIWSAADETTPGPSDGLWEYMDDDSRTFFDYIDAADRWEIEYWISRFGGGDAVKAQIRILFRPKYVISKIDEAGNPMEGIRFQVLNSKGDVVEEWESTKEKKTLYLMPSVYIPGYTSQGAYFTDLFDGLYTLTEVAAPSGFVRAEDVSVDLSDMVGYLEKETTDVVILNEPTRVRVCKVDQDGNLLAGAKMQV